MFLDEIIPERVYISDFEPLKPLNRLKFLLYLSRLD